MAKIHFTKLDYPFSWFFKNYKQICKYYLPIVLLTSLFFAIAINPLLKVGSIWSVFLSIIGLIGFCCCFWKYILKSMGTIKLSEDSILGIDFNFSEADLFAKKYSGKIIKYYLWLFLFNIIFYILLLFSLFLTSKLPLILGIIILSIILFISSYIYIRFFSLSMPAIMLDENKALYSFKLSWEQLNRNVFAMFFSSFLVCLPLNILYFLLKFSDKYIFKYFSTLLNNFSFSSYVSIFCVFSFAFLFVFLTCAIFLFYEVFKNYLYTSAYLKSKGE